MGNVEEIKAKARDEGDACVLTERQAAALLNLTPEALQKQREPGRAAIRKSPSVPFRRTGRRVDYYLADLLRWEAETNGLPLPPHLRALALLMGEDFCREIGMEPAGALPSARTVGAGETPPPAFGRSAKSSAAFPVALGLAGMLATAASGRTGPNRRGPKSLKEDNELRDRLEAMGVSVRRHPCRFESLAELLLRGEPQDEWLFCVPPGGRPYDFTEALLAGGNEDPFVWMGLGEFLSAVAVAAADARDVRLAEAERLVIEDGMAPAGGGEGPRAGGPL